MSDVASSDTDSASAKQYAYSDSVLAWYPATRFSQDELISIMIDDLIYR